MAKFTATVQIRLINAECTVPFEVPDDELEDLSEGERNELISRYGQEALEDSWEWSWAEVED